MGLGTQGGVFYSLNTFIAMKPFPVLVLIAVSTVFESSTATCTAMNDVMGRHAQIDAHAQLSLLRSLDEKTSGRVAWDRGLEASAAAWSSHLGSAALKTFKVAVFGGSMTYGVGCNATETQGCPWSSRLQQLLDLRFGKGFVEVVNMAIGASCTPEIVHSVIPRILDRVPDVDVVLHDYSVNDAGHFAAKTSWSTQAQYGVSYEAFARQILCLQSRPALMLLSTLINRLDSLLPSTTLCQSSTT